MLPKLIVIGGPTASGKTSLAIELALHYNTEIISADSRQFYREISIGTAKPSEKELNTVKHHFINSHSINEVVNAGTFALSADKVIDELFKNQEVVIVVGGSGLYIKSLLEGLDDLPPVTTETRTELRERFKNEGLPFLLSELKEKDPDYFEKVDRNNHVRVMRALEIIYSSGKTYSSFLGQRSQQNKYKVYGIAIDHKRETLYKRIDQRTDEMMNEGFLAEAKSVFSFRDHPALHTVGYTELFDFFDGKYDLDRATELIKQHTRNYAKRQLTWFRNQGDFKFFPPDAADEIKKQISGIN